MPSPSSHRRDASRPVARDNRSVSRASGTVASGDITLTVPYMRQLVRDLDASGLFLDITRAQRDPAAAALLDRALTWLTNTAPYLPTPNSPLPAKPLPTPNSPLPTKPLPASTAALLETHALLTRLLNLPGPSYRPRPHAIR